MSIISNEHQSGSPFEQEPSEPGCICGRGVRCPLHGGPPQPGPEPATTEHQPGSPPVDLDELDRLHAAATQPDWWLGDDGCVYAGSAPNVVDVGETDWGARDEQLAIELRNAYPALAAELRTLRARVGELEAAAKTPNTTEVWGYDSDGVEMTPPDYACEGKCGRELRVHGGMCAGCLEGARLINRLALKRESERAESAEARVRALEAEVESEHRLYTGALDYGQARITDLESQLTAARANSAQLSEEEQGLEARVREVLGERFFRVRIARHHEFWQAEWREVVRGETLERFADAETLPALLRAILEVEKGGPDEG